MIELGESNFAIISAGSVDGVCTSAAVLRILYTRGNNEVQVLFTQSFTVNRLDLSVLKPKSRVILVDIAANRHDEQMTVTFINEIHRLGHSLFAVIDRHDDIAWKRVFNKTGIDRELLRVKPVTGKDVNLSSSGAVLLDNQNGAVDPLIEELCRAADAAVHLDFSSRIVRMVNQAIKSRIDDDVRKRYLVYHMANGNVCADDIIVGWIDEYEEILFTHYRLIKHATCVTKGIVRIDASNEIIDLPVLISSLYESGVRIVIVASDIFNPEKGYKFPRITIATNDKSLDILSILKPEVPTVGGLRNKANIDPELEQLAVNLVLDALVSV